MASCSPVKFNHRLRRFRKRVGALVRTARIKTRFVVIFTLLLCGWADVQERFHIVDECGLNLALFLLFFDAKQPIFCLILKPFKRNAPYDRYPSVGNFAEE